MALDRRQRRITILDFLLDGKKKSSLIRELLGQRMRRAGLDGMDYQLEVDRLGEIQLLGTPEGGIVTIVETVIKMTNQGVPLSQILESIENHRKNLGHSASEFRGIINIAKGASPDPCLSMYCRYRMSLEQNSLLTQSEVNDATVKAFNEIINALSKFLNEQPIPIENSDSGIFDIIEDYAERLFFSVLLGGFFGLCIWLTALLSELTSFDEAILLGQAAAISFGVICFIRRWDKIYTNLIK